MVVFWYYTLNFNQVATRREQCYFQLTTFHLTNLIIYFGNTLFILKKNDIFLFF